MSQFSQQELNEIYTFAVDLGKCAGKLLLDDIDKRVGVGDSGEVAFELKDNAVDIVTQTDEDAEAFIRSAIHEKYPSHKFIGEESYFKGQSRDYLIDEKPTWCVDPLDGTVNYTHIFPMFCVSIAFIINHRPVIGVIYAPFMNQLFSSSIGCGAWLNEERQLPLIRKPSIPPMPANAPSGEFHEYGSGDWWERKGGMVHGVRSLGSATLDLAYTAMVSLDIWWEAGCWEWDVAAGVAILLEAGGLVTTANLPEDPTNAPIEDIRLGSRLYLAIRPAGLSVTETGRQMQERVIPQVWRRVLDLEYSRARG